MSLNWSQLMADAGNPAEPVPDGPYGAVIDSAQAKQSKNGKDMFVVKWKILNGPSANRQLYHNFVVSPESPNAMAMFFGQMNTLGLDAQFFSMNPTNEQVCSALVGRQAVITVGHRLYNEQVRNEVTKIERLVGSVLPSAPSVGVPVPQAVIPQAQSVAPPIVAAPPVPQPAPQPAPVAAAPAPAAPPVIPPTVPQAPPAAPAEDAAVVSAPPVPF